jgi:hypothetical protein
MAIKWFREEVLKVYGPFGQGRGEESFFFPHSLKPKSYYRKVQAENLWMRNTFIYA